MRIAGIKYNDIVDGIGICVSLWTQGCPFHCKNCHNPQTWDFNGGYEVTDLKGTIVKAISANGVIRNFSILGGEPLCPENVEAVKEIISTVRIAYNNYPIKIFVWTGYILEQLQKRRKKEADLDYILSNIDYLIDGPFIEEERDITLWLRGSSNQSVYKLVQGKYIKVDQNKKGVIYHEQY